MADRALAGTADAATPAWARRVRPGVAWSKALVSVLGVIMVLGAWVTAGPASGAPVTTSGPSYYLALGDSLSTGLDAPPGEGYVADIYAHYQSTTPGLQLVEYGCPGETTTSFINGPSCGDPGGSQLQAAEAFLRAHPGQVAFVTIDIGGNDLLHCASTAPTFSVDPGCVTDARATIQTNLTGIMAGLRSAGGSVPIYAMNYFDPFVIAWLQGAAEHPVAQESVALLAELNGELASIYAMAGASVVDVASAYGASDFSDLVSTPALGTVPVSVANACAWLTVTCVVGGPEGFGVHPDATGYQVIANAFLDTIGVLATPAPPSTPSTPPTPLLTSPPTPAAAAPSTPPAAPAPPPPSPGPSGSSVPASEAQGAAQPQEALAATGAPLETAALVGLGLAVVGFLLALCGRRVTIRT